MLPPFDYLEHRRACAFKQQQRRERIASLPVEYKGPLNNDERTILTQPIDQLVSSVHSQSIQPIDILRAYTKVAVKAHENTNCLTEILAPAAEGWLEKKDEINLAGPLAGIPVSLKDTVNVAGFDTSVGYSRYINKPFTTDGAVTQILKRVGAVPYVKTALPISLLSFESSNDLWGRCTNPHNKKYSPGGSTGGEGALLALGGRIGIGTDVAGSVRAPAHFSGIYSLRCSTGRWPKWGLSTSMAGQEGIPSVASPMTRTLNDLVYFSKAILSTDGASWELDHTVHPIPWRQNAYEAVKQNKRLRIGVMRTDGVVDPSPACARALSIAADSLRAAGHDVFDLPITSSTGQSSITVSYTPPTTVISPPVPYVGLQLASILLNADGCQTFLSHFRSFESNDAGARQMALIARLAAPIRWLYTLYVRYVRRDPIWAGLVENFRGLTAAEQWTFVAKREAYRADWHAWWRSTASKPKEMNNSGTFSLEEKESSSRSEMDFILTPPNATPAVPHDGMHSAVSSCGYTFLWNILDYTAGIVPVTKVSAIKDSLSAHHLSLQKKANGVSRGAYEDYDASAMQDLPVAVQLVGRRLEEERVLAGMEILYDALKQHGEEYQLLNID